MYRKQDIGEKYMQTLGNLQQYYIVQKEIKLFMILSFFVNYVRL